MDIGHFPHALAEYIADAVWEGRKSWSIEKQIKWWIESTDIISSIEPLRAWNQPE